jgi:hypothetical protein
MHPEPEPESETDAPDGAGEKPDTTVARVPSVAIAEMLAGALADEGVPARVTGADWAYPSMDWAYGVQVRVPASRLAEARAIVETEPDPGAQPDGDAEA